MSQTNQRYRMVRLFDSTGTRTIQVHRLVALAFHGQCKGDMQVAHNDGNAHNNRADNLRWDTASGNCADRRKHGTQVHLKGENNGACKHPDTLIHQVMDARRTAGSSFAQIAKQYGLSTSQVFRICTGKSRAQARM